MSELPKREFSDDGLLVVPFVDLQSGAAGSLSQQVADLREQLKKLGPLGIGGAKCEQPDIFRELGGE